MRRMMQSVLVLLSVTMAVSSYGQDVYSTQKAQIKVIVSESNSQVSYSSKELKVLLDYEDATFKMDFNPTVLKTMEGESISENNAFSSQQFELQGKLGLEYINTNGHPPLEFDFEGVVASTNTPVYGSGKLEHISNRGKFSCVLTLNFSMTLADLGLEEESSSSTQNVQVQVTQIVLNRTEDQ